jgi:putative phosphoesterase
MFIGVIADTHGLLRPEARVALDGARLILHAGDIGRPEILEALRDLAPVRTVRGNMDMGVWTERLPKDAVVEAEGFLIYMLHDLHDLRQDPQAAGYAAVISGHTHRPKVSRTNGVLYLNPGSAGPRRFSLPVTLARLHLHPSGLEAEIVTLETTGEAA